MRYGYVQLCTWTFYFLSLAAQVRRARARRHTCASWGSNTYANAAFAAMWVMQMVGDKSRVLSMNVQNNGEIGLSFGYYANATGNTKFTSAEAEMRAAIENGMRGVNVAALQQQKLGALHTFIELLFGVDAFRIHNDAVALSTRSDGSRDWAGYAGYTWQQTKLNDWTAAYGSLGTYGAREEAVAKEGRLLYNFSARAAEHMDEAGRHVPIQILREAIEGTKGVVDPRGSRALMHTIEMWKNGKPYQLDVLYDKTTNSIWHFQYSNSK